MPYSYVVYTGNGSTTQFAITFPYIRKEHVKVYVNYVDTAYTYVNDTTVQLAAAPASPLRVEVRRVTPLSTRLVDYTDGSTLVAADLDTSNLQSLYNEQELDDSLKQTVSIDPATGLPSAGGQRITNVGNPTSAQDAATKSYVDTADALKVAKAGDSMTGALAMGSNKITGLGTPTANADAATKLYVDTVTLAGNVPDGDRGDITVSGVGTSWTIDAGAVTSAKILDGTIVDADVNASAGITAGKLSFTQAGTGAIARTVDSKLKDTVSAKDFGAVGDGVADDTAAIQAAITYCCANKLILDGADNTYKVGTIDLNSNCFLRNFNLVKTAASTDFTPVLNLNATSSPKENFVLWKVNINGNRQNQTSIDDTAAENGGRHGIRIRGKVNNILIRDCKITYCAADGIQLYALYSPTPAPDYVITNVIIDNCDLSRNRRHGLAYDQSDGLQVVNCTLNNNGTDLNSADPLSHGNRGSREGGVLYGNGIDGEEYGAPKGSRNIAISNCTAILNAKAGIAILDPVWRDWPVGDPAFRLRTNIRITDCTVDAGVNADPALPFSLIISPPAAYNNSVIWNNVLVAGINLTDGYAELRAIDNSAIGPYSSTVSGPIRVFTPGTVNKTAMIAQPSAYGGVSTLTVGDTNTATTARLLLQSSITGVAQIAVPSGNQLDFLNGGTSIARMTDEGGFVLGGQTQLFGTQRFSSIITPAGNRVALSIQNSPSDSATYNTVDFWSAANSNDNRFSVFYTETPSATARGWIDYNRAAGQIRYNTTSDGTLKTILGNAPAEKSLKILNNTVLKEFYWNNDSTAKPQIGVIAQELYSVFPGAVSVGCDYEDTIPAVTEQRLATPAVFNDDGSELTPAIYETVELEPERIVKRRHPWGVDKTAFTFHLIAGYQALAAEIKTLKDEIDKLKNASQSSNT